jgi:hypothetical protein
MAAEALHLVGKAYPWCGASGEYVNIGLNPRRIVVRASVNELHIRAALQDDAKAGTARRTDL